MKALVLCAGYGARLGSLTDDIPKPLLPLQGEPLLGWTLNYLAGYGFTEVAVNAHHQAHMIRDYCGDGSRFGVRLHYAYEPELQGTAGAIKRLAWFFEDAADFLVIYGDLLVDQDLGAMLSAHQARDATATLLLHKRSGSNSIVQMDETNRIVRFLERPGQAERRAYGEGWVNSGLQILSRTILSHIPSDRAADLPKDVYAPLAGKERLFGFPLTGNRYAIDSPERYQEAQAAIRGGRYRQPLSRAKTPESA